VAWQVSIHADKYADSLKLQNNAEKYVGRLDLRFPVLENFIFCSGNAEIVPIYIKTPSPEARNRKLRAEILKFKPKKGVSFVYRAMNAGPPRYTAQYK